MRSDPPLLQASRTGEGLLGWGILKQSARVVGNGTLLGGGPPSKPPGPTLDHGLVSPIGWGFSDLRKVRGEWRRWGKKCFFEDSRFKLFKRSEIFIELGETKRTNII